MGSVCRGLKNKGKKDFEERQGKSGNVCHRLRKFVFSRVSQEFFLNFLNGWNLLLM